MNHWYNHTVGGVQAREYWLMFCDMFSLVVFLNSRFLSETLQLSEMQLSIRVSGKTWMLPFRTAYLELLELYCSCVGMPPISVVWA